MVLQFLIEVKNWVFGFQKFKFQIVSKNPIYFTVPSLLILLFNQRIFLSSF